MSATPLTPAVPPAQRPASARLNGLDMARALALLAMIATHTLPLYHSAPGSYGPEVFSPTVTGWVYAGRSSVLFAVLAGATLVLMRNRSLSYLWTRSAFLVVVGAVLELLGTPVLIILGPLAVAMAVTAIFRRCSAAVLLPLAASWLLVAPWVNQWLSVQLAAPANGFWASWAGLQDWLPTAWHAYPIPIWVGYSLLGAGLLALFIRHSNASAARRYQHRPGLLWMLFGLAAMVATTAWLVGSRTVDALSASAQFSARQASIVETGLWVGNFVPQPLQVVELWQLAQFHWLPTPHSGAALAVWQHAACAVAMICLCLLLMARWPRLAAQVPVNIVCAIGRWSLTNYVLHLFVLAAIGPFTGNASVRALIVFGVVLASGVIAALTGERGPLETLLGRIGSAVARVVTPLRRRSESV